MLRLTRGFTNQRLTLTPGLTSCVLTRGLWRGTTCRELTGEIPRVNFVVNSNLCLEQPALSLERPAVIYLEEVLLVHIGINKMDYNVIAGWA